MDPTQPTPAANDPANVGTVPPPNPALKALEDAWVAIKVTATSPEAERFLITGVVSFLSKEFPPAAPFLGFAQTFLLNLLGANNVSGG
jgi:hypothetical protein